MLFSEPKIPQFASGSLYIWVSVSFQCSSASRKFLNSHLETCTLPCKQFQCSSASRKFLNCESLDVALDESRVSVLFSEPKIPQSALCRTSETRCPSFSALQRAENSSIRYKCDIVYCLWKFQCSSASRKFLNLSLVQSLAD